MTINTIVFGTAQSPEGGDTLHGAFTKVNSNFASVTSSIMAKIDAAQLGVASGIAQLDANGIVLLSQLPVNAGGPLTLSGDATGSGTSGIVVTLTNSGVVAGSYSLVSVDAKGRVVSGSSIGANDVLTAIGTYAVPMATRASLAGAFASAITITASGDATGTTSLDGSANVSIPLSLSNTGVAVGTYSKVSVDAKGRVLVGSLLTSQDVIAALGTYAVPLASQASSATVATSAGHFSSPVTMTASGDASGSIAFDGSSSFTLPLVLAATGIAVGTYNNLAVDQKGRATSGSYVAYLTANQTVSISGDASGTGSTLIALTLASTGVSAGTYNLIVVDSKGRATSGSSVAYLTSNQTITASGDATGSGSTAIALTLAASGVAAGTYNTLVVDAKGRAISGSNAAFLTANQVITHTGDATGSGTTLIPLALSTTGVIAGTYNTLVVDAKGRALAGSNAAYLTGNQSVTISGDASGTGSTAIALTLAASGVAAGTYSKIAVDAKGRAISGSSIAASDVITALGTYAVPLASLASTATVATSAAHLTAPVAMSISGDATGSTSFDGSSSFTLPLVLASSGVTAGTYNTLVVDAKGRATSGSNAAYLTGNQTVTVSGDASGSGSTAIALTLAASGVTAGTYNTLVVDAKGRAISGSTAAYLTGNQTVTVSGDATGSGSTAIALTLAASGVTAGTYNTVVVDAKGRATSGSNAAYLTGNQSVTISGDASGSGTTAIALALAASGVTAGTYSKVTVDAKGRVTVGAAIIASDVTTALNYTPVNSAWVGVSNGIATIGADGFLSGSLFPPAISSAMHYVGTWNASGNSPALTSGTGTAGALYKVATAGTFALDGTSQWNVGDFAVYNGTKWDKWDGLASEVRTVAGRVGDVVISLSDVVGVAPLASPAFSGAPTAPTPATSDSSTTLATTAFVKAQTSVNQTITVTGDATGTGSTAIVLTLAASGVTAGTYNTLVVDAKGRATTGSNAAYLTGNQTVTVSGDATGSGSTGIALTLATSGVTAGTYNTLVVDAKGRATSGSNAAYLTGNQTVAVTGDATGSGSTAIALTLAASGVTAGTYTKVAVDAKGRVLTGALLAASDVLTALGTYAVMSASTAATATSATSAAHFTSPVSMSISGDASGTASFDGSASFSVPVVLAASGVTAGTYNTLVVDAKGRALTGSNAAYLTGNQAITHTGDATGTGTTLIPLVLAASGVTAGTYNTLVVDAKGRALAGSNTAYLTGNQSVTISGDASGTGSTAIALTLAASGVTAGTYSKVTVDAKGRAISGSSIAAADVITALGTYAVPLASLAASATVATSAAHFTNPVAMSISGDASGTASFDGSASFSVPVVLAVSGVTAGTYNTLVVDAKGRATSGSNAAYLTGNQAITHTGDATGSGTTLIPLVLAASGVTAGTYNTLVVDAKGRATSGSNAAYLTGNQSVTISGDAIGTGSTAITLTLAASGVSAGTYSKVTVDAKGRVLTGSSIAASDVITALGTYAVPLASLASSATVATSAGRFTSPVSMSISGDATGSTNFDGSASFAVPITLAVSGVTAGTYNTVVVDAKGRAVSGSNAAYLTGNQSVAVTGDATGSGSTAIALTLAASGVTAGTYSKLVVDVKGRVTSGSAIIATDVTSALNFTPVSAATVGVSNGIATIGSDGYLSGSLFPPAISSAMHYVGTWNASTNSPTLTSSSGSAGAIYKVATAGTFTLDSTTQWNVGDFAVYNGTKWDKWDGLASEVRTVAGRVGDVTLLVADVSGAAPLASPALSGTPTAPTPSTADSSTTVATTAFVKAQSYLTANQSVTVSGDATGSGTTAIALTLAASGVTAGTYNTLVVDAKGRAVTGSNAAYLTGNQTVTVSGDASGTGATAISLTLAASGVVAGTYNTLVVDSKGRAVSGSNATYLSGNQSVTVSGDASGTGSTAIALTLAASGVTAGTYSKVTVDAKGRVVAGASIAATDVTTALAYIPANRAGDTFTNSVVLSAGTLTAPTISFGSMFGSLVIVTGPALGNVVGAGCVTSQNRVFDGAGETLALVQSFNRIAAGSQYPGVVARMSMYVGAGQGAVIDYNALGIANTLAFGGGSAVAAGVTLGAYAMYVDSYSNPYFPKGATFNANIAIDASPALLNRWVSFTTNNVARWTAGSNLAAENNTTLLTSAAQTALSSTLTFASVTGVAIGMYASGTGITSGTTVSTYSATSVVLSAATTGTLASGASIFFYANTGSNFNYNAYDDNGLLLSTPLTISRSTGLVTATYAITSPSISATVISATSIGTNSITANMVYAGVSGKFVADKNVPVQVDTTGSGQAFFGVNKSGAYGILFGYVGTYGTVRMVTSDPLYIIVNNNVNSAMFASDGTAVFFGAVTTSGSATFNQNIAMPGASSTFSVGAASTASTLTQTFFSSGNGATVPDSSWKYSGGTTLSNSGIAQLLTGTFAVAGSQTISGSLTASGAVSGSSITSTGGASFGGAVVVTGSLNTSGAITTTGAFVGATASYSGSIVAASGSFSGALVGYSASVSTFVAQGVVYGLAATGTTQSTAASIGVAFTVFTTVASGAGGLISNLAPAGTMFIIWNKGANALLIYPQSGAAIDSMAANAPYSVSAGAVYRVVKLSSTVYLTA